MSVVLVVDDEPDIRVLVAMALRGRGHTILEAADGATALAAIAEHDVDIVLLDVRMPDMTGWEVLERLAPPGRRPRVVMVSAHVDAVGGRASEGGGLDGYLSKPFMPADLIATVDELGGR